MCVCGDKQALTLLPWCDVQRLVVHKIVPGSVAAAAGVLAPGDEVLEVDGVPPPPPLPSRTGWTRLVPPPVLIGHVSGGRRPRGHAARRGRQPLRDRRAGRGRRRVAGARPSYPAGPARPREWRPERTRRVRLVRGGGGAPERSAAAARASDDPLLAPPRPRGALVRAADARARARQPVVGSTCVLKVRSMHGASIEVAAIRVSSQAMQVRRRPAAPPPRHPATPGARVRGPARRRGGAAGRVTPRRARDAPQIAPGGAVRAHGPARRGDRARRAGADAARVA